MFKKVKITLVALSLVGISHLSSAQSGYISPFNQQQNGYGSNYGYQPQYGQFGNGYQQQQQMGYGNNNYGNNNYGNNNSGYNGNREQSGGAPVAPPAPIAGSDTNKDKSNTTASGETSLNPSTASPKASARGSILEGDILHGRATALSGNIIMVEGIKVILSETSSPEKDFLCSTQTSTWRCGEKAQVILNKILSYGPSKCTVISVAPSITGHCVIGLDDVSLMAVQNGSASASGLKYKAYSIEAMNDKRGIWANGR